MPRGYPRERDSGAEIITVAPLPESPDDMFDGDDYDSKTMEDWLLESGAKRDRRGNWYRVVPDPRVPLRRVVENGEVFIEQAWTKRAVATASSWDEALKVAKGSNGRLDALIPGVGWVRGGWKIEREHPDNIGTGSPTGPIRTTRTKAIPDMVAAEQAVALRPVLDAVAGGSRRATDPGGGEE